MTSSSRISKTSLSRWAGVRGETTSSACISSMTAFRRAVHAASAFFAFLSSSISCISFSSSSSFFIFRPCRRRNLAAGVVDPVEATERLYREERAPTKVPRTVRSHLCGPGASGSCSGRSPAGGCFGPRRAEVRLASLHLPLSSPPSVPVGRCASQAPHHGCVAGPRRAPIATVCRSCRSHERSPRCRLRFAEARGTMGAFSTKAIRWVLKHHGHTNKETRV